MYVAASHGRAMAGGPKHSKEGGHYIIVSRWVKVTIGSEGTTHTYTQLLCAASSEWRRVYYTMRGGGSSYYSPTKSK